MSEDETRFPKIPKELLDRLEEIYPERSAAVTDTEKRLFFEGGQRSVIRMLRMHYEEQNEGPADTKVL